MEYKIGKEISWTEWAYYDNGQMLRETTYKDGEWISKYWNEDGGYQGIRNNDAGPWRILEDE